MLGEGAPENKNLKDFFFDKKMAVKLHLLLFKIEGGESNCNSDYQQIIL